MAKLDKRSMRCVERCDKFREDQTHNVGTHSQLTLVDQL